MGGLGSGSSQVSSFDGSRPDGLPQKPKGLNKDCSEVWDDLLSQIQPNILRRVDSFQLESLAQLLVQSRALGKLAMANPVDVSSNRAWLATVDLVRKLSACFGLSPSDRKRLSITDEPPEEDPYAALLARRAEARHGQS